MADRSSIILYFSCDLMTLYTDDDLQWHPLVRSFLNAQREMLYFQHPCPDPRRTLRRNAYIDIPIQAIDTGHQLSALSQDEGVTIAESS
jgi:hypothetical protein